MRNQKSEIRNQKRTLFVSNFEFQILSLALSFEVVIQRILQILI
jgi:hypothetical protein